jgi:hypothetical protein
VEGTPQSPASRSARWEYAYVLTSSAGGLNLLTLRGTVDALLKRMTWVNAIGMGLLFTLWLQSITLPIVKIRQHLEK